MKALLIQSFCAVMGFAWMFSGDRVDSAIYIAASLVIWALHEDGK